MSKLKFESVPFLVILVLLLLNVRGCGGQSLSSKLILKAKKQIPIPKEHVYITFLTPWILFVGILGFQSITLHCKTPCNLVHKNMCVKAYCTCMLKAEIMVQNECLIKNHLYSTTI